MSSGNDDLEKSKLKAGLLAAGLVAGGLTSKPAQAPAPAEPSVSVQVGKPEMLTPEPKLSIELGKPKILNQSSNDNRWTPTNLIEEMHPIAHLESSWGKNMAHAAHSKGDYHTAVGAVGLKPITAHEEYRRTKALQEKYPGLIEDAGAFTRKLKTDHKFYNDVASAHWNTLKSRFGTPERTAYAWRWGWGSARKASDEDIANDGYVQKYQRLSQKLGKGELVKGSLQRKTPYNPADDQHSAIGDWQNYADPADRDKIPRLEGNGRARALHGLHSRTASRRNPATKEREFLLHRGYGPELQLRDGGVTGTSRLSWTSNLSTATNFGRHGSGVVSAWVPESGIHHVLRQVNGRRNDLEEEVIVDHSSVPRLDVHHVMSQDQVKHARGSIPIGDLEEAGRTGEIGSMFLNKATPKLQSEAPTQDDTTYRIQDKPTKKKKVRPEPSSPLVAVHSLDYSALDKILDEYDGKIPSPSIAIVNVDHDDEDAADFGSIKLIGRPHLVDPVKGGLTFDADAYTPRHPRVREETEKLTPDVEGLRALYRQLNERTVAEKFPGDHYKEKREKLIQKLTDHSVDNALRPWSAPLSTIINAPTAAGKWWYDSLVNNFGPADYQALQIYAHEIGETSSYAKSGPAQFLWDNKHGIKEWFANHPVFSTTIPKQKKVIVREDGSTAPLSPETALKEMTGRPVRGGEGAKGLGEVRAIGARRFKTLHEIRQAAGKIIPEREMRQVIEEIEDDRDSLLDHIHSSGENSLLSGRASTRASLSRAMKEAYRTKDLDSALANHGLERLSPETREKVKGFMEKLVNAPTSYFESKPQRIVHLNEFAAALVPERLADGFQKKLAPHGIRVIPYKVGDGHTAALKHYTQNEKLRLTEMKKNENNPTVQVVSVACFNKDGKLLFGLRGDSGRWCMPGGKMEAGEDPEKAVIRELLEETNLKPTELSFLGSRPLRMGNLLVHSFRATVDGTPDASNDPDKEFHGFVWADAATPPRAIRENLHNTPDVTLDFLAEAMEESLAKAVLDPSSGYEISAKHLEADDKRKYPITKVTTKLQGKKVGEAVLAHLHKGQLHPESVIVEKSHRRRGIASAMYRMAENATGRRVVPGPGQTADGKKLWEGNLAQGQFGALKKDEPKQAEMFEDVETPTPAGKSNLAVVHNITHDKLESLHKLGGKMPAPSLAVASTDLGMDNFGSITLIGHPDLVDPEKGTPVYEADAYTPRHPPVEWERPSMTSTELREIDNEIDKMNADWMGAAGLKIDPLLTRRRLSNKRVTPDFETLGLIYHFAKQNNEHHDIDSEIHKPTALYDKWYKDEDNFQSRFANWVRSHPVLSKLTPVPHLLREHPDGGLETVGRYTPKRALREMQRVRIRGGEAPEGGGPGWLRAQGAKRFKSLQEIRDSAKKIKSSDEVTSVTYGVATELPHLLQETALQDPMGFSHGHNKAVTNAIKEHLQGRDLRNALARHGIPTLSDEMVNKLKAWSQKLLDTPTNYFEAKPQRVVDLREFKAALVHQDGVKHAKGILDKYKIPVIPYRDEEHRRELLAQHTQDNQLRLSEKDAKDQS